MWNTLVEHSCETLLWDTPAGHSYRTLFLVGLENPWRHMTCTSDHSTLRCCKITLSKGMLACVKNTQRSMPLQNSQLARPKGPQTNTDLNHHPDLLLAIFGCRHLSLLFIIAIHFLSSITIVEPSSLLLVIPEAGGSRCCSKPSPRPTYHGE